MSKQKAFVLENGHGWDALDGFSHLAFRFEGVSRDSGCGHEESHLMHDTEYSI